MDPSPHSLNSQEEWYRSAVRALDGKLVMVSPGNSDEHPPVGMRGTIRVRPTLEVEIVLDFPVMYDRPAEKKIVHLDDRQTSQLLASENGGAYSITLSGPLESPPVVGYVVASPRL